MVRKEGTPHALGKGLVQTQNLGIPGEVLSHRDRKLVSLMMVTNLSRVKMTDHHFRTSGTTVSDVLSESFALRGYPRDGRCEFSGQERRVHAATLKLQPSSAVWAAPAAEGGARLVPYDTAPDTQAAAVEQGAAPTWSSWENTATRIQPRRQSWTRQPGQI